MGLLGNLFNNANGQTAGKDDKTYPQAILSRTRILEGRYVNSIINNGGSYFLIDLPVFEDGVVDCWENVDLDQLKTKISSGWLSPVAPNKVRISKHHLAGWEIESSKWYYTKENYYDFLLSIVKSMNPNLTNLFHSNGKTSKVIGNTNYSAFPFSKEKLVRKDHETNISFKEFKGEREHFLFKKSDGVYWLCNFNIYSDSSILIDGIDSSLYFQTKKELEPLIKSGTIVTKIPDNSTILIQNLGEIKISKTLYNADVMDKFSEIDDIINQLNGMPTTSDACVKIYEEYTKNPTNENKLRLKSAYEKIPMHLRIYVLGDMDAKDWPIRTIIYENE